jgi:hypothetical protein
MLQLEHNVMDVMDALPQSGQQPALSVTVPAAAFVAS